MSEHLPKQTHEQSPENIEISSRNQSEKLRQDLHERAAEDEKTHNKGEQLETARNVVEQEATTKEELQLPNNEKKREPIYFTKADRERSFHTTMHHVRSQLSRPSQTFSKLIHQKQIEKTSEFVGKTVVRPSGVMGAATAALIGVSILLFFAKHVGFQLSGSEFWILLCVGYLAGLLLEAIRKLFSKKDKLA